MRAARTKTTGARRASIAAVCGTTALAIIGGSLLTATAATAATGSTYSCLTTSGSTQLVDFSGTGNGLVNLGSSGGLVGIGTASNGLQVGLLNCTAVLNVGGTSSGATVLVGTPTLPTTTPIVPTTTPTVPTTTPTVPVEPTTPTDTPTPAPTTTSTTPTTATTTPAASTKLSSVKVSTSTSTVYPSATGYSKSKVTFSIKGLTSAKGAVKISGTAVLRKGTKVVKTWAISNTTSKISWNGKVGKKVKAGLYTLTVTAWSSDGTKKVSTMKVRVSAKHLVTRTLSAKTVNLAAATTDKLPAAVAKAFTYGKVTIRIHTVASVTGAARIAITGPHGEQLSIPLKNGSHTTKSMVLPKGFTSAKFRHVWKQGAATLTGLYTTFTYKQLV